MQFFNYVLQVMLYTGCFALIYQLLLLRSTNFGFSRAFIWVGILLPIVLPFIILPSIDPYFTGDFNTYISTIFITLGRQARQNLSFEQCAMIVYGLIAAWIVVNMIVVHKKFRKFLHGHDNQVIDNCKVYVQTGIGPGSYGKAIFLYDGIDIPEFIIRHELAHIRHRHYLDLVILQLVKAVCWPNIFLYILSRQLKLVHEYQSDRYACSEDVRGYSAELLKHTFGIKNIFIAHQFFHHPLKNRIMMLQNRSEKNRITNSVIAVAVALTFSAGGMLMQSGCVQKDVKIYEYVDDMPAFKGDINQFLSSNITYPDDARSAGKEGRIGIRFVVNEKGKVQQAQIIKSSGTPSLDKEALRVVTIMPDWQPGKLKGNAVSVFFQLPVTFRLD